MSGEELGRPKYAARQGAVSSATPPQFQGGADTTPRSARFEAPGVESGRQKSKRPKDEPTSGGTVYVPVGRAPGYGLWRVARFIVLMLVWLVLTMFKIALSPFVHIMGGSSRPRWE